MVPREGASTPVGGRVGYDFYYVGHRAFCFSNLFNLLLLPLSACTEKKTQVVKSRFYSPNLFTASAIALLRKIFRKLELYLPGTHCF